MYFRILLNNKLCNLLFSLAVICVFTSCQKDNNGSGSMDQVLEDALHDASEGMGNRHFIIPDSDDYANIPQDPNNPLTAAKVNLGKLLYHETAMAVNPIKESAKGTYSCASCHHAVAGFQACKPQGIGEGGIGFGTNGMDRYKDENYEIEELDIQPLRSPSTLNSAFQEITLWNGQFGANGMNKDTKDRWDIETPIKANYWGFDGVETQAIAGLAVHRMEVGDEFFQDNPQYIEMFDQAFPDYTSDNRYSLITSALAIAAYERTLLSNQSPFQKWLKGDLSAMTLAEKEGATLFFGKAQCGSCHNGPALNKMEFHAIGMRDLDTDGVFDYDPNDNAHLGRGGFTGNEEDNYKFKVPQLYNLIDSPFYGHGSSFNSVRDVVTYKNNGVSENPKVGPTHLAAEFKPLGLSDDEVNKITAFIETGLRDDNLNRYIPESLPSGNCFPNNDPESKSDLGCE